MKKQKKREYLIPFPTKSDRLIERFYHLDLFQTDFFVLIGDHALLKGWAKDVLGGDRLAEFTDMLRDTSHVSRGRQYPMLGGGSVIWLKPGEDIKYLIHEVTHAATHLMRDKGLPITSDTDELLAYLVETLYARFV